jgi:biopolymer transport protein TolR
MPKVHETGGSGSSRLGRGRRVASTLAEINVVPLVDVMLVLLIIFMVTAPMIQRGVEVKLPEARQSTQIEGERPFVTVPASFRQERVVFIGEERIRMEALGERIRQRMENATDKAVYLQGDGAVQLQEFIEVMDRLKEAGVSTVGLVTDAPRQRAR